MALLEMQAAQAANEPGSKHEMSASH